MNIKNLLTKKPVVIAVKTVIVGAVVSGLAVGVKALISKKTGLPEGYEGDIGTVENGSEESK